MWNRAKELASSLMLVELLKGLRLTGRFLFARKITVLFPEEKTPQSARFRQLLKASEADLAAVVEDRDRLIRSNHQYRGMALRLAEKLRRMTA